MKNKIIFWNFGRCARKLCGCRNGSHW